MTFRDEQLQRILDCLGLGIDQLEKRRTAIDREIGDELHELRNIMNTISLELQKRRMTQ